MAADPRIAIVGAGVSGLTSAVVLRERGYEPHVFAEKDAERSTSGAAAAIWYPYDAGPEELAVAWGMFTYGRLLDLLDDSKSGVSLVEFRSFSRTGSITPPLWTTALGARHLERDELLAPYRSGYTMRVPLMDANLYLPYLRGRIGEITYGVKFDRLEDVDRKFDIVINCTGFGARALVNDPELEPHRGQVVIVEPVQLPYAFVCDEDPLTYVIPRRDDCVLGGCNDNLESMDETITTRIVDECSRVLNVPLVVKDSREGNRPFRKSGVRVEADILSDGRRVIHNYGHGGAGFSLSWGCAHKVAELVATPSSASRSATHR